MKKFLIIVLAIIAIATIILPEGKYGSITITSLSNKIFEDVV